MKSLYFLTVLTTFNFFSQTVQNADSSKKNSYTYSSYSKEQNGVEKGTIKGPFEFHSKIIPNTVRLYWVYISANYDKNSPANLIVFNDGQRAINPKGALRIPTVLDNLIFNKKISPTIGLFVTPGNLSEHYPEGLGMSNPNNRLEEYDVLDDQYSRFILEELLPEIGKSYTFSSDPKKRIIGGTSSGAIAAFTVAWHHPEAFGNVISLIGSYTSIGYLPATNLSKGRLGGDSYPTLIRKNAIKPIRIFLQDGSNDIDNEHGNWFLSNQQMLLAFQWANANAEKLNLKTPRYDINYNWGTDGHSDTHGGVLLPEIITWLWRD